MSPRASIITSSAILLALALCTTSFAQDEPALPAGLGDEPGLPAGLSGDEPSLPSGLDTGEPDLPTGLDEEPAIKPRTDAKPAENKNFLKMAEEAGISGFWEARGGFRTQADRHEDDASLAETRLQLQWLRTADGVTFKYTGDLVYDAMDRDRYDIDLVRGGGWFDLRELWASFSPTKWMDVKAGRQILTWGTADMLFLNDQFPKDWRAFFIGRDVEYLKAPADAMKVSMFSDTANVDIVYMPRFAPSRHISGHRVSYYSTTLGRRAGQNAPVKADMPNEWFDDSEAAARISRRAGSYELAAYGYWGYWKTPEGFDPVRGVGTYPRLSTYGASIRGPLGRGIANAEAAYYDSRQDRGGKRPFVRNSEVRMLVGYETDLPEIAPELTIGLQYYVELMQNYGAYSRNLPAGAKAADRDRHVATLRLTKQLMNQNLTAGIFTYYSPTDADAYVRPNVQYKIDDHWTAEVGANVFLGKYNHTFFGQFERNTNIYTSIRWSF